jgi:hypothetical protein
MQTLFKTLLIAVLLAISTSAQPNRFHRFVSHSTHYAATHKELLISDIIIASAESADAASSTNCQKVAPITCIETNPLIGKHPSNGATWRLAIGYSAGMITLDHLIWHYAPEPADRHLIWLTTIPIAIDETFNVKNNVDAAQRLTNARNALMRNEIVK